MGVDVGILVGVGVSAWVGVDAGMLVAVGVGVCAGVTFGTGVVAPIVIGVGVGLSSQALRVLMTSRPPKTASLRVRRMKRLIWACGPYPPVPPLPQGRSVTRGKCKTPKPLAGRQT